MMTLPGLGTVLVPVLAGDGSVLVRESELTRVEALVNESRSGRSLTGTGDPGEILNGAEAARLIGASRSYVARLCRTWEEHRDEIVAAAGTESPSRRSLCGGHPGRRRRVADPPGGPGSVCGAAPPAGGAGGLRRHRHHREVASASSLCSAALTCALRSSPRSGKRTTPGCAGWSATPPAPGPARRSWRWRAGRRPASSTSPLGAWTRSCITTTWWPTPWSTSTVCAGRLTPAGCISGCRPDPRSPPPRSGGSSSCRLGVAFRPARHGGWEIRRHRRRDHRGVLVPQPRDPGDDHRVGGRTGAQHDSGRVPGSGEWLPARQTSSRRRRSAGPVVGTSERPGPRLVCLGPLRRPPPAAGGDRLLADPGPRLSGAGRGRAALGVHPHRRARNPGRPARPRRRRPARRPSRHARGAHRRVPHQRPRRAPRHHHRAPRPPGAPGRHHARGRRYPRTRVLHHQDAGDPGPRPAHLPRRDRDRDRDRPDVGAGRNTLPVPGPGPRTAPPGRRRSAPAATSPSRASAVPAPARPTPCAPRLPPGNPPATAWSVPR